VANNNKNQFKLDYHLNKEEIFNFLFKCDDQFPIDLSDMVDLKDYSDKLAKHSTQTCFYNDSALIGILLYYTNNKEKSAFIPIIGILKEYQSMGIGTKLLLETMKYLSQNGFNSVRLEVHKINPKSLDLFLKYGFDIVDDSKDQYVLEKVLEVKEDFSNLGDIKIQLV